MASIADRHKRPKHNQNTEETKQLCENLLSENPIVAHDTNSTQKNNFRKVFFLLENASLQMAKIERRYEILNGEEHHGYLKKKGLAPADYRPDILHQCILSLLDSPLNKAGYLELFIHTTDNKLIRVDPQTRFPRTFKRFCGLFEYQVQLLQEFKIYANGMEKPLLQLIRNPIADHLPEACWKTVCTYNCDHLMNIQQYAKETLSKNIPMLYVVGTMAHGKVVEEWADEELKISSYPLSASSVCHRICAAYENLYEIL